MFGGFCFQQGCQRNVETGLPLYIALYSDCFLTGYAMGAYPYSVQCCQKGNSTYYVSAHLGIMSITCLVCFIQCLLCYKLAIAFLWHWKRAGKKKFNYFNLRGSRLFVLRYKPVGLWTLFRGMLFSLFFFSMWQVQQFLIISLIFSLSLSLSLSYTHTRICINFKCPFTLLYF